jgi:hypothetical protein
MPLTDFSMRYGEDRLPGVRFVAWCILFLVISVAAPFNLQAACHAVTATGSGGKTGADWNNALAGLPATLVRGDSYYLADGSYSQYVFATADSGSTLITIKKAIASDHCTATGWNLATMGSSQAVFDLGGGGYGTGIVVRGDYLVINGQVGAGEGTTPYGIKFNDAGGTCSQTSCYDLMIGDTATQTKITVEYLEIEGACGGMNLAANPQACDTYEDSSLEEEVYINNASTYLTFAHDYFHHAAGGIFQFAGGASNVTIENCFLGPNNNTPTQHGEGIGTNWTTSTVTIAYNSFHDIEGTAIIAMLGPGAGQTYTNDAWGIYGNVVWYTAGNGNNRRGVGDGFFGCVDSQGTSICSNILIYNNTFANMTGAITEPRDGTPTSVSGNTAVIYTAGATGSARVEDNLWYNNSMNLNFAAPGTWTEDYNTSLKPGGTSGLAGTHDVTVSSGGADPFANDAGGTFSLTNDSQKGIGGGLSLPSPYNLDCAGAKRGVDGTWDRGAYQFGSSRPNPVTLGTPVAH